MRERVKLLLFMSINSGMLMAEKSPNVLIIQTDEHNFRTLGCYRAIMREGERTPWGEKSVVETPHIDYLAQRGVLCDRFYASTPVSSPSRSSFVSGLYPQQTDVVGNDIPLNEQVVTFAEEMRRAGYSTGYMGKWHLDGDAKPGWQPTRQFGFTDNRYMLNRGHYKRIVETATTPDITYKGMDLTAENFMTDFLTDKVIEFIEKNNETPFCCFLSLPDPHGPNVVRAPYNTMYTNMHFDRPLSATPKDQNHPHWAYGNAKMENMAQYYGMIKCIDDNVGRMIEVLKKNGQLDNTIIVFTSDHGDLCGEHGLVNKGVPLEASARIPFIISYPAKLPKGKVVSEALSVVDFAPTILELVDIQTQVDHAGRDFTPLLLRKKAPRNWDDVIFMRGTSKGKPAKNRSKAKNLWVTAASSRYKLTYSEVEGDQPWLTDLEVDPFEMINLYQDERYQEVAKELAESLLEYGKEYQDDRLENAKIKEEINQLLNK